MKDACKDLKSQPDNASLKQLKSLGNQFVRANELTAQEATVLLLRQPLLYSTRTVVYINTAPPEERHLFLKKLDEIEKLPPGSTDITMKNFQVRYLFRPKWLKDVCLADWMSQYVMVYRSKKTLCDEQPLAHGDTEDDSDTENVVQGRSFKLENGEYARKIAHENHYRIIKSIGYSENVDKEKHYREKLMMYYPFHLPDEADLLNDCSTFSQRYLEVKAIVDKNQKKYEFWRSQLDDARTALQEPADDDGDDEDGNDNGWVAPNIRAADDEDILAGPRQISRVEEDFEFSELVPNFESDEDFSELLNSLNNKQQVFLLEFLSRVKKLLNDSPNLESKEFAFLSGGAGTGKSVLIRCLYQLLIRLFRSHSRNPAMPTVGLTAFTALAARNIGGTTIHSLLGLGFGDESAEVISSKKLCSLRSQLLEMKVLVIDEISLVGAKLFARIDERLRQIMVRDHPFGGVNILAVGDLMQLEPVMDGNVFEVPRGSKYSALTEPLWSMFRIFELTEVMRQSDASWYNLLNRLRFGELSEIDFARLNTLLNADVGAGSLRACYLRKNVDAHKKRCLSSFAGEKVVSKARDRVKVEYGTNIAVSEVVLRVASTMDDTQTGGLFSEIVMALGLPYMITTNVDKLDGLVNGAIGVLTDMTRNSDDYISILWLKFPDEHVGSKVRASLAGKYGPQCRQLLTPIQRIVRRFGLKTRHLKGSTLSQSSNFVVERSQFPLVLASATTIHKTQGKSFDSLELDFQSTRPVAGLHYVGLTRCRTESGNSIVSSVHRNLIAVNEKARSEMYRMRSDACFDQQLFLPYIALESVPWCHRVLFHNIQSLNKNRNFVKSSILYQHCTFVFLLETWLKPTDNDVILEGYNLTRFDWQNQGRRLHAGIVIYANTRNANDASYAEIRVSTTQFIRVLCEDPKINVLVVLQQSKECSGI